MKCFEKTILTKKRTTLTDRLKTGCYQRIQRKNVAEKSSIRINEKRILRGRGKLGADNRDECNNDIGR